MLNPETFRGVYIDACHAYEAVARDIAAWWPMIEPGGMLCGHDYVDNKHSGAKTAVDEFCRTRRLDLYAITADSPPSWAILKP